jgi:superfamily II DNA or RNA helicase
MNSTPSYTRANVVRWLGQREVLKGQLYLDAVSRLDIHPEHISALVKGSMPSPYEVKIDLFTDLAGNPKIKTLCSCPVAHACKHVAATLLAALEPQAKPNRVNPEVLKWLESFRRAVSAGQKKKTGKPAKSAERLFYVLGRQYASDPYAIAMLKGRIGADGCPASGVVDWSNVNRALLQPPSFVDEEDLAILRLLWAQQGKSGNYGIFPLSSRGGGELLTRLLASGRLFYRGPSANRWDYSAALHPLLAGDARVGTLEWRVGTSGVTMPQVVSTPAASAVLFLGEPWYLDLAGFQVGRLQIPYPSDQLARLMEMPPLSEADIPVVVGALRELAPDLPPPDSVGELRVIDTSPVPVLVLGTLRVNGVSRFRGYSYSTRMLDFAHPRFRYGDVVMEVDDPAEFFVAPNGETVRVKRQPDAEKRLLKSLENYGLAKPPVHAIYSSHDAPQPLYALENESAWTAFMGSELPRLRAAGWEIEIPAGFRHHSVEISAWEADIDEDENGWFSLDMGIVVENRRMPLAPLLHELFQHDTRWLDADKLKRIPDNEAVTLTLADGARVIVPAERLKPIAATLIDLFDARPEGALRVSRLDAPRLAELSNSAHWQFKGAEAVRRMADKLKHSAGIQPVAPPAGLGLQLRPYQLEGLAWLQYLREQGLAGILADDMGLGKTAQALAHLLLEKEAGRLDRPALVVLPTSLIFNWKREAERFAPALKILSLHGKDRAERFPLIPEHDVVLTTYPLLWRDEETLAAQDYHLLILDEAQTVKNAASRSAQAVRKIQTRHRLCLTGTPLENHLGELWAQFDFLLPGFLGDAKSFTKTWRTPVEKQGDKLRRDVLAKRVKPFILRRRKEDVAKELPPKTIIVRTVELEGGQRDLYETVRSVMDKRVRDEIAAKGFARSQIIILDALLKLRQVCCDPRLLKGEGAKQVKERAKLDLLMEMLPELVDEGRRVLVFSQFTSMLDLIERELVHAKLGYVMLTGNTQDRESVVRRFQDGEVPIFLISLKAGGVGLNLTAADTVIHYDPWWNPAAENQATDRAHRIGQSKNVFVYKLVVSGSIEEKILVLQDKKAALAAGILSEDASGLAKFGASDIAALLAPLPTEVRK